jgi:hypothetical protein
MKSLAGAGRRKIERRRHLGSTPPTDHQPPPLPEFHWRVRRQLSYGDRDHWRNSYLRDPFNDAEPSGNRAVSIGAIAL